MTPPTRVRHRGAAPRAGDKGSRPLNGTVVTNDGVTLRCTEAGAGRPLVLVHGWLQSKEAFRHQLGGLSGLCRVIAYDQRGHGESDRPAHGYTVHRLAKDLQEVLAALDLSDVALAGHSLGCEVVWAYLELFGTERLGKLVLVEGANFRTSDPAWPKQPPAGTDAGPPDGVTGLASAVADPGMRESAVRGLVGTWLTDLVDPEVKERIVRRSVATAGHHTATLLYNHYHPDWHDQITRITLPTLVVGGRASPMPGTATRWVAEHIPGARLEVFEADEGGGHFMFLENPAKFNALLAEFVTPKPASAAGTYSASLQRAETSGHTGLPVSQESHA